MRLFFLGLLAMIFSTGYSQISFNKSDGYHGKYYLRFESEKILNQDDLNVLKSEGMEFITYYHDLQYDFVWTQSYSQLQKIIENNHLVLVSISPNQKLDYSLNEFLKSATDSSFKIKLMIECQSEDILTGESRVKLITGIEFTSEKKFSPKYAIVHLPIRQIWTLASYPEIKSISLAMAGDVPLNYASKGLAGVNFARSTPAYNNLNLQGQGITVGIGDNADAQSHVDLVDRLINHNFNITEGHGVHTMGTMAGAGNFAKGLTGFLPYSTIVGSFFSNILNYTPQFFNDYHMILTNNSYAAQMSDCNLFGIYDGLAKGTDELVLNRPEVTHVFAAGNMGEANCPGYPASYYTIAGQYQSAKNVITVGNLHREGFVASSSSRGPLRYDNRLKPDVCALGYAVISCNQNNTYTVGWGTSMASPAVAGVVGMLYQRYKQLYGIDLYSDIAKALIINGAVDIGKKGPDVAYGYGRVNAYRSLQMMEYNNIIVDTIGNQDSIVYNININKPFADCKFMMYYHDVANATNINHALVNDLDFYIKDPSGNVHRPWVINTTDTSTILNLATPGRDSINNAEQIEFNYPPLGIYQMVVKGNKVVNGSQRFVLVYDTIPRGLFILAPRGGENWLSSLNENIYWDLYDTINSSLRFNIDYSPDGGISWNPIATNYQTDPYYHYFWYPPASDSNGYKIRISTNTGLSAVSDVFTSSPNIPINISIPSLQCPGFLHITWPHNAQYTDYLIYKKIGAHMEIIDSTVNDYYLFDNLSQTEDTYVTIQPRMHGLKLFRANAVKHLANYGTCLSPQFDYDLAIKDIDTPFVKRENTSDVFTSSDTIVFNIANHDNAVCDSALVSYKLDNLPWVHKIIYALAPSTNIPILISGVDLSVAKDYKLITAVHNVSNTDPFSFNDTLEFTIRNLPNPPQTLNVALSEGFESASATRYEAMKGLYGIESFDLSTTHPYGELKTNFISGSSHSGTHAATLDVKTYLSGGNTNFLDMTLNLAGLHDSTDDVRLDFYYSHHGQDAYFGTDNFVYVRASDTSQWIPIYNLLANQPLNLGQFKFVQSLELSKALRQNRENFQSSFQIRFSQQGKMGAGDLETFNGYTFDDLKLYKVNNDVYIKSLDTPRIATCGLTSQTPIGISVTNTKLDTLQNIKAAYRINGGIWVTENIPVLPADSTYYFQFAQKANFSSLGTNYLDVYVFKASDSYHANDSANHVKIFNFPFIDSFPYIQNFEANDGYWNPSGKGSSWAWGTPSSSIVNRVPSGTKLWKTNLTNGYRNNELSYLTSPCFDISQLNKPYLSFNMIHNIENCGTTLCDGAWMEISYDAGITWHKADQDTANNASWYNDLEFFIWNGGTPHWRSYSLPLAKDSGNVVQFRFVMYADPGVEMEGIALDDIHVYDLIPIYNDSVSSANVSITPLQNSWTNFIYQNTIMGAINPANDNLGLTQSKLYINHAPIRTLNNSYYLDRNLVIHPSHILSSDTSRVQLYFTEAEVMKAANDTGCLTCTRVKDFMDFGMTKFSSIYDSLENGELADNTIGASVYTPYKLLDVVPYLDGYYMEFPVNNFSEFWINNDGDTSNQIYPTVVNLDATNKDGTYAQITWDVNNEYNNYKWVIERADGDAGLAAGAFVKIGEVPTKGNNQFNSYEMDDHSISNFNQVYYYRVKWVNNAAEEEYSNTVPVVFGTGLPWTIYPNPFQSDLFFNCQLVRGQVVHCQVLDMTGRMVHRFDFTASGFKDKINIGGNLASGIYKLIVSTDGREENYIINKM